jgi:hypothetical protein
MLERKMTDKEKLEELTKDWKNAPDTRVCAICLCEVNRDKYDQHMGKHGYTILNVEYKKTND